MLKLRTIPNPRSGACIIGLITSPDINGQNYYSLISDNTGIRLLIDSLGARGEPALAELKTYLLSISKSSLCFCPAYQRYNNQAPTYLTNWGTEPIISYNYAIMPWNSTETINYLLDDNSRPDLLSAKIKIYGIDRTVDFSCHEDFAQNRIVVRAEDSGLSVYKYLYPSGSFLSGNLYAYKFSAKKTGHYGGTITFDDFVDESGAEQTITLSDYWDTYLLIGKSTSDVIKLSVAANNGFELKDLVVSQVVSPVGLLYNCSWDSDKQRILFNGSDSKIVVYNKPSISDSDKIYAIARYREYSENTHALYSWGNLSGNRGSDLLNYYDGITTGEICKATVSYSGGYVTAELSIVTSDYNIYNNAILVTNDDYIYRFQNIDYSFTSVYDLNAPETSDDFIIGSFTGYDTSDYTFSGEINVFCFGVLNNENGAESFINLSKAGYLQNIITNIGVDNG